MYLLNLLTQLVTSQLLLNQQFIFCTFLRITSELKEIVSYSKRPISLIFHALCMYVCKTLFTDASLVNKIVGFHKGRQTIKKRIKEDIYKRTEKERKKKK